MKVLGRGRIIRAGLVVVALGTAGTASAHANIELGSPGARTAPPPADVSYASLLLEKGVFRPLYERGRYTRIEAPSRCDTAAYGINDRGQIGIAATGTTDGSTCRPQGGKP